jgi:cytochrome c biogenesis protein CcmG, thiol:disulfide interchange protein DsbE
MRRIALSLLAALTLAAVGCGGSTVKREAIITPVSERTPAPAFSLPNLRGGAEITLTRFAGRPVLVNFWASWCEPCKKETPTLAAFARETTGVEVLGIAVNDAPDKARGFADGAKVGFALAVDRKADVARRFSASGIPTSVLIDARGRIAATWPGEITRADLDALIAGLAAG